MTEEENRKRANDEHVKYIKDHLCDKNGDKYYVFISYKSDDWEIVLKDVVYRLVKDYGLNVYFDGSFDSYAPLWIKQFPENMESYKCAGVLAFLDDKYATSYATLLELMYSQRIKVCHHKDNVVPVNIGELTEIIGEEGDKNTGLGVEKFEDGTKNDYARIEKEMFFRSFNELVNQNILKEAQFYIDDQDAPFTKRICSKVFEELHRHLKVNDNKYRTSGEDLTSIYETIKNTFNKGGINVFSKPEPPEPPKPGTSGGDDGVGGQEPPKPLKLVHTITLKDFLKEYDNTTFKKDTFTEFRLVGTGENSKYNTDFCNSAFDLTCKFVENLLTEKGVEFIHKVNELHPGLKNPVFITEEEYKEREDQKKYRKIEVTGLESYYMYRHYSQYQWIDSVLKPRLKEYGLSIDAFSFEYKTAEDSEGKEDTKKKPKGNGGADTSDDTSAGHGTTDGDSDGGSTTGGGGITGTISVTGGTVGANSIAGSYTLEDFLKKYDNKTFQSKSCSYIKLSGQNGCEKYALEFDEKGEKIKTARQLVFNFAMKRLDEMGMAYIDLVNSGNTSANPIFITEEEHRARKAQKSNVSYTKVTSEKTPGYSMCTHYSEYDWLKNSFAKQISALGLKQSDLIITLE